MVAPQRPLIIIHEHIPKLMIPRDLTPRIQLFYNQKLKLLLFKKSGFEKQ